MPNTNWAGLNGLQIGRYAEYYAKMEMASYGFEVYTTEVDDHGIDFIIKRPKTTKFYEIQVKSIRDYGYVFLPKSSWEVNQTNLFLILLIFKEGKLPDVYLIPADAWKTPNELFKDKNYEGLKSEPEYGLNLSLKNQPLLEPYRIENIQLRLV